MKKRQKRTIPEISTASLPDIIFMLLFFFMVVTVMRKENPLLDTNLPITTYAAKLPQDIDQLSIRLDDDNTNNKVQINRQLYALDKVDATLASLTASMTPSELEQIEVFLYADKLTQMSKVNKVKSALSKVGLHQLRYVTEVE